MMDWFLGSFSKGIAGGLFTLVGVIVAFKLQKVFENLSKLPQKCSNLCIKLKYIDLEPLWKNS